MEQFFRSLGAKAGNLALTLLATRGVWIAGGIAPDALDLLRRGAFLEGFLSKGRLSEVTGDIPVYVILNEQAPLLGAARCALHHLGRR
jgi:glucokinase